MELNEAVAVYQEMINSVNSKYQEMIDIINQWQQELNNIYTIYKDRSQQWIEGYKQQLIEKINKGIDQANKWKDAKLKELQNGIDNIKKEYEDWIIKQAEKLLESMTGFSL